MLGEIHEREAIPGRDRATARRRAAHPAQGRQPRPLRRSTSAGSTSATIASRDASRPTPSLLERLEWGNFYGYMRRAAARRRGAGERPGRGVGGASRRCTPRRCASAPPIARARAGARSATSTTSSSSCASPSAASSSTTRRPPSARARQAAIDARRAGAAGASTSALAEQLTAMREQLARRDAGDGVGRRPAQGASRSATSSRALRPNAMGTCGDARALRVAPVASSSPTIRASRTPRAASSRRSSAP